MIKIADLEMPLELSLSKKIIPLLLANFFFNSFIDHYTCKL